MRLSVFLRSDYTNARGETWRGISQDLPPRPFTTASTFVLLLKTLLHMQRHFSRGLTVRWRVV
jgi:hypothetical protein